MHEVMAKAILSSNNGMNIYRGCTHGCIYCDSRSNCYQMNHTFEDIEVKSNATVLLEESLKKKRNKCMIGTGAMTDPYIHLDSTLQNTRKCLELINQYEFGVAIHTKSARILRDIDLLKSINEKSKCVVEMTLTTYDEDLCKIIEPNVSTTKERFEVLTTLRDNGIQTVVWLSPILPFINDTKENLLGILEYCKEAKVYGIICFSMGLTLRDGNREYFYQMLDKHFPGLKNRYRNIYGNSYEVVSPNNAQLMDVFNKFCKQNHIVSDINTIFSFMREYEDKQYKQIQFTFS
jgi:DNA repair photolyase